jgi:hypothetical protein
MSPDLKIDVGRSSDDPRLGKMTMVVTDLVRGNPDSALFQVPADYTVRVTKPTSMVGVTPPPAPANQ